MSYDGHVDDYDHYDQYDEYYRDAYYDEYFRYLGECQYQTEPDHLYREVLDETPLDEDSYYSD
jgi:hypothetical protein